MRARGFYLGSGILFVAAAFCTAVEFASPPVAVSASSIPAQQESSAANAPQQSQTPTAPLQVKTRLVTLELVATDSHGNVVRDLKPEELEISDGGPQSIARFSFVEKSADANASAAKTANSAESPAKGFYSNQLEFEKLAGPPTVILLDALNTGGAELMQARREMLRALGTLPSGTPVAVLLLDRSVVVAQDFGADPARLRAALDRALNTVPKVDKVSKKNSGDHLAAELGAVAKTTRSLEDFESANDSLSLETRATKTLDTLTALARYLGGYKGRKNLIWVSGSFPIALAPDPDAAPDEQAKSFEKPAAYTAKVKQAANALTDAQVAVYPVDARGLESEVPFSAAEAGAPRNPTKISTIAAGQIDRDEAARFAAQGAMNLLADSSGGKTCHDTNDISRCVGEAMADSATYYELAYSPRNVKWDGSFRAISVKTTRPGVKLSYRRGYFARTAENLDENETSASRLQQACADLLPATAISITARAVAPTKPDSIRYLMSIAPGALNFATDGAEHKLNAQMFTCVYPAKGNSFRFFPRDLTQTFSDAAFLSVQRTGLSGFVEVPKAGAWRVRIAVIDVSTGLTGALDIPMRAVDFQNAAAADATVANLPEVTVPRNVKETAPVPRWNPPQVDAPVASISTTEPCELAAVVKLAGARAEELVDHLQNFDAHEQIRFEQTDPQGMDAQSMEAKFDYLVDLGENVGHRVRETRKFIPGSGDAGLGSFVDVGLPAFALIFHPALRSDYEMRCEGLAQWNQRAAWVVYFEQSKKRPPRTVSMGTGERPVPVGVKGRAWIAADSGQVVHMETNLVSGLAALELRDNAVAIDYAPVAFHSQNLEVWLPQSAIVYTEYFRRRTIIQHTFSDFQLFSVQTQQVIQKPAPPPEK
jgi:VWFA-related protein